MRPYEAIVYKEGSSYLCEGRDGQILAESTTTPETVLNTAFNRKGDVHVCQADYTFSGAYSGLITYGDSFIKMDRFARFIIPAGYTGVGWKLYGTNPGGNYRVNMLGGQMIEAGPRQQNWTGIHIYGSTAASIAMSLRLQDLFLDGCGIGILLEVSDPVAWQNSNMMENIFINVPRVGVEWRHTGGGIPFNAINRWNMRMIVIQSGPLTEIGFKNINGDGNYFDDCRAYDIQVSTQPTPKTATFASTAQHQKVMMGIISNQWTNSAADGQVRVDDPFTAQTFDEVMANKHTHYLPIEGIASFNGDGFTRVFNIPHGQGVTPTWYDVQGITRDATLDPFTKTADATNLIITYNQRCPPPATVGNPNNVKFHWRAKKYLS